MSKDIAIMKTAVFGGFKKSDVLSYVEQLQSETAEIREQLNDKRNEAVELKDKIDELEEKLEELSLVNQRLAEKEKEVSQLTAKLSVSEAENTQYREKLSAYDEKTDKLRRAEKQIGAAYIDARRYSDELVDNAKSKAKDIGAVASQDIKREACEIEQLLKDVDAISRKFNSSLEQLHKDVYALGTKLNTSASALLNLHTDLTGIESQSYGEDASSENDNTFTVISYPAETSQEDFSDLADSIFGFDKKEG